MRTATTATVHHGDRLDILETRRRFVKVRTKDGAAGWIDSSYLLTQAQMDDLTDLAKRAAKLPSQGVATAFDTLNVHTAASRSAPSFVQLAEGNPVEVLGHRTTPKSVITRRATKINQPGKDKNKEDERDPDEENLPPSPDAPGPPEDWEKLSRPRLQDLPGPKNGISGDDWFLIRTPEGKAGWVLTRMVLMSVPDEIAQNAAGHYIMGYHAMGETRDDAGNSKPNLLWTTSSHGMLPYDFDGIRLFVYSQHHDRYETAYIERNLKGYYPVEVTTSAPDARGETGYLFSLVVEDAEAMFTKRSYSFINGRVHLLSKTPYFAPPALPDVRTAQSFDPASAEAHDNAWAGKFTDLRKRWFGK